MKKNLVVYYSHSGNTKKAALLIQKLMNADIIELVPKISYPKGMWDVVDEFKVEMEKGLRRDILDYDINLDDYATVFIGTPNWGNTVATPLLSFFDKESLSSKKVMPFVTHGGGGVGNCGKEIVRLSGSKNYGDSLVYSGSSINEVKVEKWLKKEKCL